MPAKSTVTNTKTIPSSLLPDYEPMLTDSSYITIATALEKLCAAYPANTARYLATTKGIEGTNGRNVLIKWLEISLTEKEDNNRMKELVGYTSGSYEFVTRTNAMGALRRLNHCDAQMLANILNACLSSNGRLSGVAVETIKYFYAQDKFKKEIADGISKYEANAKDKETLNRLMN